MNGLHRLPQGLLDLCLIASTRPTTKACCSSSIKTWNRRSYSAFPNTAGQRYEPTIGLELHVQLKTRVKLFSQAETSYEAVPNTHVRPFDAALPGALPVLSAEPVGLAMRAAMALGCHIHRISKFDRKHYFYPDLPAGFQITQKYAPLATGGRISLTPRHDGLDHSLDVGVTQVQLEQDTAKSMHDTFSGQTLLDLNRAGTPLIEIISDPDMHSCEQAAAYVRKVQSILRSVGSSDADMEKGSMRIDVNISIAPPGSVRPGTRCEIKNLNSIRSMTDAISYEVERQASLLDAGESVEQQTRAFDASTGTTSKLRSKADAPDYRYMPDPELAPLVIPESVILALRDQLPLLPDQIRNKLEKEYDLTPREVDILVRMSDESESEGRTGLAFFETVAASRKARTVANWLLHDLLGQFAKHSLDFTTLRASSEEFGSLIDAVDEGRLTSTSGKAILVRYFSLRQEQPLGKMVEVALGENRTSHIDLASLAQEVVQALPAEADKVRKGNHNVLARLMGEGMKRSKGRANAKDLREHLLAALSG